MEIKHLSNLSSKPISVDPERSVLAGLSFDAAAHLVRLPEGTRGVQVTNDPSIQLIFLKLPEGGRLLHLVQKLSRQPEMEGEGNSQFIVRESLELKEALMRLFNEAQCEALGGLALGNVRAFSRDTIDQVDFVGIGFNELALPRDARGFKEIGENREEIFFRSGIGVWSVVRTKIPPPPILPPGIDSSPTWMPWYLSDLRPFHVAFKLLDEG